MCSSWTDPLTFLHAADPLHEHVQGLIKATQSLAGTT